MKPLSWFTKNIGKRIYRDDTGCPCDTCKRVTKEGLIVEDKAHAEYLYSVQCDYYAEGIKLNYRNNK